MAEADLQRRIKVLDDIEQIRRLKAQYFAHCDDNYNPDALAEMFVEDAVWGVGFWGKFEGREAIRGFFSDVSKSRPFAVHWGMNPIIEVNGDTATGIWYLFMASTVGEGNYAMWSSGRYDEEYVRVDGQWKIKYLKMTSFFRTPYDQGWVKKQFAT